jgi:hypothetical protein
VAKVYYHSLNALKKEHPEYAAFDGNKSILHKGHKYNKIGEAPLKHGNGWQFGRVLTAISASALSILLIPLAIKPYRKLLGKLWNEATSGVEKISLYVTQNSNKTLSIPTIEDNDASKKDAPKQLPKKLDGGKEESLDKKRALKVVRESAYKYEHLSESMRDDEEVTLEAVKNCTYAIKYATDRMKNNKKVGLAAVRYSGSAYEYLSPTLRDDEEVTLEAVKNSTYAIKYASDQMKNNKKVALAAVRYSGSAYEYISEEMKCDKYIALEACNIPAFYLTMNSTSQDSKNNIENELAGLRKVYALMPLELKNDIQIKAAYKNNKKILKNHLKQLNQAIPTSIPVNLYSKPVFQPYVDPQPAVTFYQPAPTYTYINPIIPAMSIINTPHLNPNHLGFHHHGHHQHGHHHGYHYHGHHHGRR